MGTIAFQIVTAISLFLRILSIALWVYVIMSWFSPRSRFYIWLVNFVTPFIKPFYRLSLKIMTRTGWRVDLSAWMAMIAISNIQRLLWVIYGMLPWFLR